MTFARILILFVLSILPACTDNEPVVKVDMTRVESAAPLGPTAAITYAYLPQYSHSVSFERHRRLLEYLRHKTGLSLRQVFPNTFAEHIKMVERGEIDISFTNPFVYISLSTLGSEAFARIVEPDGGANFQGQVIVRADNPDIKRLEDCRGKRIIAVDPNSAGGFLYPMGLFFEHGITRRDFQELAFATGAGGRQEAVVLAVYTGAFDVGTIRKGTLDVVRDKIDLEQIRVLAESRPYPGWVYSVRKGFDPASTDKIARALQDLSMSRRDDAVILGAAGMIGIIPARDEDYDSIRELAMRLDLSGDFQ
jgi:phosphonate transport system substrate-binding protein